MGKRANTVLFILGATVVNLIVMMVVFVVLLTAFSFALAAHVPPESQQWVVLGLLVGSIAITYFIYYRLVRFLTAKYDLEKHFEPIFPKRK